MPSCARLNQQAKGGKPVFLRQRAQRGDDIFRFGQLRGDGGNSRISIFR
jgi:hypothetical protein